MVRNYFPKRHKPKIYLYVVVLEHLVFFATQNVTKIT